ncbi:hypothetical protein F4859DRAFT_525907 [Xylaria cf. heliscus]|nr:hypothetical protein F4859DRAFT_525907 [Xylaria cf. heliscus]
MTGDDQGAGTDDDGGRKAKRARVTVACVGCRRKKERCDGTRPACGSCLSQGRQCVYPVREKKRGLRLGYVRSLEVLLGLLFLSVDGAEDAAVALLQGKKKVPSTRFRGSPTAKSNLFADIWRRSDAASQLNRLLLSAESKESEPVEDKLDAVFAETLDQYHSIDVIQELAPSYSELPPSASSHPTQDASTSTQVGPPNPLHINPPQSPLHVEPELGSVPTSISTKTYSPSISQLPLGWHHLIESYHCTVHVWFPIIPKQDIWRYAHMREDASSSPQNPQLSAGELACLWAVVSCASYRDLVANAHDANARDARLHNAAVLVNDSMTLPMASEAQPEVGHVQALLVFVIHHLALGSLSQAWLLIGRAIYMAVDLGLFKLQSSTKLKPFDDKTERACLGCFVLDTLVALRLGRRPYLRMGDLHNIGLSSVNGIEEWELSSSNAPLIPMPARILSSFNNFVALVSSVNYLVTLPPEALDKPCITNILQPILTFYSSFKPTTSTPPQTLNNLIISTVIILSLWSRVPGASDNAGSTDLEAMLRDLLKTTLAGLQEREYGQLSPLYNIYLRMLASPPGTEISQAPDNVPGFLEIKRKLQELCAVQADRWTGSDIIEEVVPGGANRHPSSIDSCSISLNPVLEGADVIESGDNELYNSLSMLGSCDWEAPTLEFLENLGVSHDNMSTNDQELFNTYCIP